MKKKILAAAMIATISVTGVATAQSNGQPSNPPGSGPAGGDLNQFKQKVLQNIQSRIQALQTAQNCVSAATSHDALKQCREQEHLAMETERHR